MQGGMGQLLRRGRREGLRVGILTKGCEGAAILYLNMRNNAWPETTKKKKITISISAEKK